MYNFISTLDANGNPTTGSGQAFGGARTIPSSPITNTDFGYTGQRDLSMGLMDYHARFYNKVLVKRQRA